MLLKYKNYINEAALTPEEIEQKKMQAVSNYMRMYLSKDLSDILKTIDHPIAQDLLTISRRNVKFSYSFMDLPRTKDKKDIGKVTYLPSNKIKAMEDGGLDLKTARNNYNSEVWVSKSRVEPSSIGKVVKKMYKEQYSLLEIERFSNLFKAKLEEKNDKLKMFYGTDIQKWYLEENYAKLEYTLGGSCMRQREKNKYLQIYAENTPDNNAYSHVGLLVLFDDNQKVLGRSVIWFNSIKPYHTEVDGKITNIPRIFMDRIYAIADHYFEIFINYAKENNWLYKKQQSYDNSTFIDPKDNSEHKLTLSFRLKPGKYNYYPYMDSLYYYTPDTGRVGSQPPIKSALTQFETYKCRTTSGSYEVVR